MISAAANASMYPDTTHSSWVALACRSRRMEMARDYIASLPAGLFPNMTSLASEFALADPDERFELLLDIFVDGLARRAAAG